MWHTLSPEKYRKTAFPILFESTEKSSGSGEGKTAFLKQNLSIREPRLHCNH